MLLNRNGWLSLLAVTALMIWLGLMASLLVTQVVSPLAARARSSESTNPFVESKA